MIFRTIAVHFTNPFHVSTRVVDKCNDGGLLLQVEFSPVWHMCMRVIAYVWQLLHCKIWNPNIFFKIILLAPPSKEKFEFLPLPLVLWKSYDSMNHTIFAYLGASGAHGTWVHVFDQTMATLNRWLANTCKYVLVHLYFSLKHASNSLCWLSKKKCINLIFACTSRWLLQLDQFSPFRC